MLNHTHIGPGRSAVGTDCYVTFTPFLVSSHATAPDTGEPAPSFGSQPESGRAFSRPPAGTLDATNTPQRVHPILYQGNLWWCVRRPRRSTRTTADQGADPDFDGCDVQRRGPGSIA